MILTLHKLAICDFVCGMNFGIKAPPTLFCFLYKSWSILCCLNFFCITIRDKNTSCQNLSVLSKVNLHRVKSYWGDCIYFPKKYISDGLFFLKIFCISSDIVIGTPNLKKYHTSILKFTPLKYGFYKNWSELHLSEVPSYKIYTLVTPVSIVSDASTPSNGGK